MGKRGQVAVVVVIGLVLLIGAFLVFYLKSSSLEKRSGPAVKEATAAFSSDAVYNFVTLCLQKTGKDVLFRNGRAGGYFILPAAATRGLQENAPFYAAPGRLFTPSDETLARELARGVDALLFVCLNEFKAFGEQGITIEAQTPSTTALLTPTGVQLKTVLPVRIAGADEEKLISEFVTFVDAPRWLQARRLAETIAASITGPFICIDCFARDAEQAGLYVGILPLSNNQYLFDIKDEQYQHNAVSYHIRFAVAYDPTQPLPEEEGAESENAGEINEEG